MFKLTLRLGHQAFSGKLVVLPLFLTILSLHSWVSGQSSFPQTPADADQKRDEAIRKRLEAPPFFWDETHQGPTLAPQNLPKGVFPMDCRATQAFLHRVSPGQYHFQRAQYLLGKGPDFIGCEALGLDRFPEGVTRHEKGVEEALAALRNPIGLQQWRPEAPRYVLVQGYRTLANDYEAIAKNEPSTEYHRKAKEMLEAAERVEGLKVLARPPDSTAGSCLAMLWFTTAAKGDVAGTKKCLDSGTAADRRDVSGMTALMHAVLGGHAEIVSILLAAKADPNVQDNEGSSALRDAVVTGHLGIVERLLAKGARVDALDSEGTTALMDAAAMGFGDIVERLLASGASVNTRAGDGSSALLVAVAALSGGRAQRSRIINALIAKSAEVNIADWHGDTPLIEAAQQNDIYILGALTRAAARVDMANLEGETALEVAAKQDQVRSVHFLLSHNANPNIANQDGETPLMLSAKHAYPAGAEMVKLLLAHQADVAKRTKDGQTALMFAADFVRHSDEPWPQVLAIFQALISHGADANAADIGGKTALMAAAENPAKDNPIVVDALLKAGANLNSATTRGTTALMLAAQRGHPNVITFLLSQGADVNARDTQGRRALEYTAPYRASNYSSKEYIPACIDSDFSRCAATREILQRAMQKQSK